MKIGDIIIYKQDPRRQSQILKVYPDMFIDVLDYKNDMANIQAMMYQGRSSPQPHTHCDPKDFTKLDGTELVIAKPIVKIDYTKLDPLVIDQNVKDEILAVLKQHTNFDKIFKEWGLDEIIKYGKGMTFMFYGLPGTGKTWAAHCIANAMGKELLVIGAAEIQTSEPGGANRNIKEAFDSAKSGNKVLFLDECDSLITVRNDVGMILSSEINTLLTEIENFEGVVILATNRIDTLDPALERRISLIVEFPEPDTKARENIWERMLPKKMPLEKGLSPEKLSEFHLTGAQIKNVILQAARLAAASESKFVGYDHFESAINRILRSKNLMGMASRYRQVPVKDQFISKQPTITTDKVIAEPEIIPKNI